MIHSIAMTPIYLHVPPEEYPQAEAAGAVWDARTKCWTVASDPIPAALSRWLDPEDAESFNLEIETALVAAAQVPCGHCHASTPVLTLYGELGMDLETGERVAEFTVSCVWAVDAALARQLERWPYYRRETADSADEAGTFANHCIHCGAVQPEQRLHDEPGDVFFGLSLAAGGLEFTRLQGAVRLSGDYAFKMGEVEP